MKLEKAGDIYIVSDTDVEIKFSNISVDKAGINALVRIFNKLPVRKLISTVRLNLLAPRSITTLANQLSNLYPNDWHNILQASVTQVAEATMCPPEPEALNLTDNTAPTFLVDNFLLEQAPILWFAPGGSGKSFLALALAICIENGWDFFGDCQPANALYLDWETDIREMNRRASLLVGGLTEVYETSKEKIRLPGYMRMDLPLVNAIDGLIETCYNHNIKFTIIDSVAPAQSADLNSPADTTKFFTAVRKLNTAGITTLMVTHVSKGEKKDGNAKRTPFGSVFFENFPRLTWELRSEYDEQNKSFLFGIFCRKSNVGKLEPKGIRMTFLSSKVEMEYVDPEETEINDEKQTLSNLILALLEEKDMSVKEISDVLQANPGSVRTILNRLKNKGSVTVIPSGEWSLNREEVGF
jgi:hypothetical protein